MRVLLPSPLAVTGEPDHTCWLPYQDEDHNIYYFDAQHAQPGDFSVPGVVDLETVKPGSLAEVSWIYFKGDPQAGPQPGHPFKMPFDNQKTTFKLNLVNDDKELSVVREIMAPANASVFWNGGGPFGPNSDHQMYIPRLDESCKYSFLGLMLYRWNIPTDVGNNSTFRLKLVTHKPSTEHISGKVRISDAEGTATAWRATGTLSLPSSHFEWEQVEEQWSETLPYHALGLFLLILLAIWGWSRLRRKTKVIAL